MYIYIRGYKSFPKWAAQNGLATAFQKPQQVYHGMWHVHLGSSRGDHGIL